MEVSALVVAIGGALGAYGRYAVNLWAIRVWGTGFPYGILVVNVLGCFFMGLLFALMQRYGTPALMELNFVVESFLGALTTFSTFSMDTWLLFQEGAFAKGMLNLLVSLIMGLLAVSAAVYLAA